VEQARREAVADWITTGLTPGQILALQNATVQITDLNSEGAFGFAGSRLIQLDDDALGFGWHVGSGPVPTGAVDLGTVMRHELGHILGYGDLDPATAGDSIMSGTILPGERRFVKAPAQKPAVPVVQTPVALPLPQLVQLVGSVRTGFFGGHEVGAVTPTPRLQNSASINSASNSGRFTEDPHSSMNNITATARSSSRGTSSQNLVELPELSDSIELQILDDVFSELLGGF
jgi:hypothetical protein